MPRYVVYAPNDANYNGEIALDFTTSDEGDVTAEIENIIGTQYTLDDYEDFWYSESLNASEIAIRVANKNANLQQKRNPGGQVTPMAYVAWEIMMENRNPDMFTTP